MIPQAEKNYKKKMRIIPIFICKSGVVYLKTKKTALCELRAPFFEKKNRFRGRKRQKI